MPPCQGGPSHQCLRAGVRVTCASRDVGASGLASVGRGLSVCGPPPPPPRPPGHPVRSEKFMQSQGEHLRGSGKFKMTQKAPVSVCASPQLRSMEVSVSPPSLQDSARWQPGGVGLPPWVCPRIQESPGLTFPPWAVCWAREETAHQEVPTSSLVFIQHRPGPGPCSREAFLRDKKT